MSEKTQSTALMVGKWAVGIDKAQDVTLLRFDFTDRPAIMLAISRENADQIANAILDQLKNSPPSRGGMN